MQSLRLLLNSAHSGANAWFALTEELRYFEAENVAVEFIAGTGAYSAAKRLMDEPFDLAFGDIHALLELSAELRGAAPVAVFCVHSNSPSVIGIPQQSDIRQPADLPGRILLGHASDVALKTFGCYARAAGIDAAAVELRLSSASMIEMLLEALAGSADGVFGYYSTQTTVLRVRDAELSGKVRFLRYPATVPDLFGSFIMASRAALREKPDAVGAALTAFNRGLRATLSDPASAVAAVIRRNPTQTGAAELQRLNDTIAYDILHPELRVAGVGGVDPKRLERDIALFAATASLARRPGIAEIFTPDYLPALSERLYAPAAVGHA